MEPLRHVFHLTAHFSNQFSVVCGLDLPKFLGLRRDQVGQAGKKSAAGGRGELPPSVAVKG